MERLKRLIPVFIICAIPLIITGCKGGFDASGYTGAILDLQFQGDAGSARAMVAGATSETLQDMYQEFIDNFVAGYITDGMDISEEEIGEFRELAAIIFSSMRYEVGEAKKTGRKEYEVPVVIQPADTFLRYKDLLAEDAIRISGKIKNGKYQGTDEEVQNQVMAEIARHAYDLLEKAYGDSEFGDKKTVILKVKADTSDIYSINEDDMDNLIVKILRLDEIGG